MLTWAYAWISKQMNEYVPLIFIIAMGCDVAIFYYIAAAFGARF